MSTSAVMKTAKIQERTAGPSLLPQAPELVPDNHDIPGAHDGSVNDHLSGGKAGKGNRGGGGGGAAAAAAAAVGEGDGVSPPKKPKFFLVSDDGEYRIPMSESRVAEFVRTVTEDNKLRKRKDAALAAFRRLYNYEPASLWEERMIAEWDADHPLKVLDVSKIQSRNVMLGGMEDEENKDDGVVPLPVAAAAPSHAVMLQTDGQSLTIAGVATKTTVVPPANAFRSKGMGKPVAYKHYDMNTSERPTTPELVEWHNNATQFIITDRPIGVEAGSLLNPACAKLSGASTTSAAVVSSANNQPVSASTVDLTNSPSRTSTLSVNSAGRTASSSAFKVSAVVSRNSPFATSTLSVNSPGRTASSSAFKVAASTIDLTNSPSATTTLPANLPNRTASSSAFKVAALRMRTEILPPNGAASTISATPTGTAATRTPKGRVRSMMGPNSSRALYPFTDVSCWQDGPDALKDDDDDDEAPAAETGFLEEYSAKKRAYLQQLAIADAKKPIEYFPPVKPRPRRRPPPKAKSWRDFMKLVTDQALTSEELEVRIVRLF